MALFELLQLLYLISRRFRKILKFTNFYFETPCKSLTSQPASREAGLRRLVARTRYRKENATSNPCSFLGNALFFRQLISVT